MVKRLFPKKHIIIIICILLLFGGVGILAWHMNRNLPSEPDSEDILVFDEPYNIGCSLETQVANLQRLGMVWGFAKYTHLAFLAGEKCWDKELLYLIPIIRFACLDDVNNLLYNWFIGLGDDGSNDSGSVFLWTPVNFTQPESGILYISDFAEMVESEYWLSAVSLRRGADYTLIGLRVAKSRLEALDEDDDLGWLHSLAKIDEKYMRPLVDMSWLTDESFFGSSLVAAFSRFNETPVIDRSNAPVYFDVLGTSRFSNQNLHADMDFQDDGYRLLGLFRLWNAMKYFFPYIDIIDGDWNEILLEHIPMMLEATDRLGYELTLMSLASRLNDAHVFFVSPLGSSRWNRFDCIYGEYVVPVRLTEAEEQLVVLRQVDIPGYRHELIPGDVVAGVNGIDINDIVADMLRFVSYPNEEKALFYLELYSILRQRSPDSPMELDILRDSVPMRVEAKTIGRQEHSWRFLPPRPVTAYERLDNNIGLINPSEINPERAEAGSIQHIMQYFADTNGLIIDLRQRPGFPLSDELAEYLVETTQLFATATVPSQSIPGVFIDMHRSYAGGLAGVCEYAFFYENNVVVLMNENALSLSEFTVMALRTGANVTIMGSNSMGANGNIRQIPLPGDVTMNFSSIGIFTPDGGQTQRIGLKPDIHVPRTIAGIRDGRDELLEAAVQYLLRGYHSRR